MGQKGNSEFNTKILDNQSFEKGKKKKNTYVQISGNIYAPKFLEMSSIILKSAKKSICPHLDLKVEMASTGTHFNFQIYVFYFLEIN